MVKKLRPVTWVSRLTTIMIYDLNFSSNGSCKPRTTDCYLKAARESKTALCALGIYPATRNVLACFILL